MKSKNGIKKFFSVVCTTMLAAVCVTSLGLKPHDAHAACSHQFNGSYQTTWATCTRNGERVGKCTKCGKVLNRQVLYATGHNWVDKQVVQTRSCTRNGIVIQRCTKCGTTRTNTLYALGHASNGSYTVTKQSTCTTDGQKVLKCTRAGCGAVLNTQSIPKTGHNHTKTYTNGLEKEYCSKCGTVFNDAAANLRAALYKRYSKSEADRKFQQALQYLNQAANLNTPSDKKCAMYKLLADINGLGDFSLGNEKMEKCANACEYVLLVKDLKTVFNYDSSNVDKFESTLSALSTTCGKIPLGEQTIGKALDTMNETLPQYLRKAESSINYQNMTELAADSLDYCSYNTINVSGKEKHVADLTLVELANNYDEVNAILRIHYDALHNPHDDGREMNSYAYNKAKDNYVQTFVRTKIAAEEKNYTDFAQYVTYCVEH